MKKQINKQICTGVLVLSVPLIFLVGCAGNDGVRSFSETAEMENNLNEMYLGDVPVEAALKIEEKSSEVENPSELTVQTEAAPQTEVERVKPRENTTPMPQQKIIRFAFDQADVEAEYGELLWQYAQYMKENPKIILNISGHTDSSGVKAYNQMLSEKRAQHVANLLQEFGVPRERIRVMGFASDRPLANASSNREQRRVELEYSNQDEILFSANN